MSTLALCPSRGRPGAAAETLRSFLETRQDPGSRLVFIVDADDPTQGEYPAGHTIIATPSGSYVPALNAAAKDPDVVRDATSVGFAGDDNRFVTPGWDLILDGWLSANIGIAYGDDGFQHEKLPTSWWVSRPIVDVFGMADPGFRHLYPDNWWKALGEGAGCLRYFPDVSIEHLHPHVTEGAGWLHSAKADATYKRGNSSQNVMHDRSYFHRWERTQKARDVRRLRAIISAGQPRRVLADWHHPALWESLEILFRDRFGWELYAMGGPEWKTHGWAFETTSTIGWTADDYLSLAGATDRGTHHELIGAEYPERPRRLVTWDQAQAQRWDFVLASVAVHQRPFGDLARAFGARLIHQVGNARHPIDRRVPQITLASAVIPRTPGAVSYHQEFSQALFAYTPPTTPRAVTSFMLRLDRTSCPYQWLSEAPGIKWAAVGGASPRDPNYLAPMSKVAERLRGTGWVWADKRPGDGYGHAIFNSASVGRPLIGHASHYKGLLAEPLWSDLETAIDLDKHSERNALRLIRAVSADPEWHRDMSEHLRDRFDSLVDFTRESEQIREVLA